MKFLKQFFEKPTPQPILEAKIEDCETIDQLREAVLVITNHLGGGEHCNCVSFPENMKERFPNLTAIATRHDQEQQ